MWISIYYNEHKMDLDYPHHRFLVQHPTLQVLLHYHYDITTHPATTTAALVSMTSGAPRSAVAVARSCAAPVAAPPCHEPSAAGDFSERGSAAPDAARTDEEVSLFDAGAQRADAPAAPSLLAQVRAQPLACTHAAARVCFPIRVCRADWVGGGGAAQAPNLVPVFLFHRLALSRLGGFPRAQPFALRRHHFQRNCLEGVFFGQLRLSHQRFCCIQSGAP
jgi:hypothetical protein